MTEEPLLVNGLRLEVGEDEVLTARENEGQPSARHLKLASATQHHHSSDSAAAVSHSGAAPRQPVTN